MDVRCERCKTEYEFDDARVTESGVTVRCTTCQHVFVVKKRALVVTVPLRPDAPEGVGDTPVPLTAGALPSQQPPPERPREWRVRQVGGNVFTFRELTTLQKWIVERKVTRDDEISATGETWKRLGNIAELASFFQVVDEAQRAQQLQSQMLQQGTPVPYPSTPLPSRATPAPLPPGAQPPGEAPPPTASQALRLPPGDPSAWARAHASGRAVSAARTEAAAPRRGALLGLLALALLAAAGYGAWRVWEARQRAAAVPEAREPAVVAAPPPPVAPAPEAVVAGDGGANAGLALAEDGGTPPADAAAVLAAAADAGPGPVARADAGVGADAGARAARPEPSDFEGWMAQAEDLRERERTDAALVAYGRAAALAPQRPEAHAGRGLALLDLGRGAQAERAFQRALALDARHAPALMGLAEAYRAQGRKAEALQYYQRYLEAAPDGPEASVARAAIERLKE